MYTTQRLAEAILALRAETLPPTVRRAALNCILDLLGAAWAGHGSLSAIAQRKTAVEIFGAGPAEVWFSGDRLTPPAAAMVNAAAASALDLDDGHRGAAGHPGAAVIPSVFAAARAVEASPARLLAAIAVGYEVACRVAAARDLSRLPTLSTGRWAAYGVAAATGYLHRVSAPVLAQALAIAGVQAPDLAASGYSRVMGNHVKEGIPWAVLLGTTAVTLARRGFTGPLDVLDHPDWFDAQRIIEGQIIGRAVEAVYFKPYSNCRWGHAALDALLAILAQHGLDPAAIDGIGVQTFARALRLNNYPDPETIEAAQYSIPFCLGVAAFQGPEALLPLAETSLHHPQAVALARRVALTVDPALEARFPAQTPARVIVRVGTKRLQKTVLTPRGDPANPMSRRDLERKFRRLTADCPSARFPQDLLDALARFDAGGLPVLLELLGGAQPD